MKKIDKQDRQRFTQKAIELIESLGAARDANYRDGRYRKLNTIYGVLWLWVDDEIGQLSIGNVFTHFAEPERASKASEVQCNRHTGKWNFHYFENWSNSSFALHDLSVRLTLILPKYQKFPEHPVLMSLDKTGRYTPLP